MMRALVLAILMLLPATAAAAPSTGGTLHIERVLVCPDDPSLAPAAPAFDEAACVDTGINQVNPQGRALWLRARVTAPESVAQPLGIRISAMASSDVYWNGRHVGANGRPAAAPSQESPGLMDAELFLPAHLIQPGENLLAVRMSAQHMPVRVEMPVHMITIGPFSDVRDGMLRAYLPALIASGATLLAAVFFMGAFVLDRRQWSAFWLSLMTLFAVGQVSAEVMRGLLAYPYTMHVPRLMLVTAFACLFAVALTAFMVVRFKVPRPHLWVGVVALAAIAVALLTPSFDGKALLALTSGAAVSLAALARPAWSGQAGARWTAAGLGAFIALVFLRPEQFLDRDFYLSVSALMGLLFVDQVFAMRRERVAREAAQQHSARVELELLRRGMAPHFLMNTLNSLAEWVETDPKTGVRMIEALGEQMRALGAIGERDLIPLGEELDLVRSYIAIMSYRTNCKFSLLTSIASEAIRIPPGVVHTLTENAFSHNRYPEGGEFRLEAAATERGTQIVFETPPSEERCAHTKGGAGHAYVRSRLASVFGEAAAFSDGQGEKGRWRSLITLPAMAP